MTSKGGMRASDCDREHAAEMLRDAYAVGRLDLGELRRRTGASCSARTWRELRDLTADLPEGRNFLWAADRTEGETRAGRGVGAEGAGDGHRGPMGPFAPMVVMAVIWLIIAAAGHVAAAIPLVLLSLFVLPAACWKPPHPVRRLPPHEDQSADPARQPTAVPDDRSLNGQVPGRFCRLSGPRHGRYHHRR